MNQFIFIIIILVILVLFKINHLYEKFESVNPNQSQQYNKDIGSQSENDSLATLGIYNYFYQQVTNPYKYPMTPFFSNDSQELPKPSPKYPEYSK